MAQKPKYEPFICINKFEYRWFIHVDCYNLFGLHREETAIGMIIHIGYCWSIKAKISAH